ncbi:MAG: beta-ketoacyl-ACP synthase II [Planctomycetota bacterium]|nr:beta-ketoacyl-ACP synthase II [Planctomycetota bacterium]
MSEPRRVVVTGLGAVSPLGIGVDALWNGVLEGTSGIRPITRFDASAYATRIAGEVPDFDPTRWMDRREVRRMDPFTQYGLAAASLAVEDSGLETDREDPTRIGVILGSGIGGLTEMEAQHKKLLAKGPDRVSPFLIPKLMVNAVSGEISIRHGFRGPNFVTASACASGAHAIGLALRSIRSGESEIIISGGSESTITTLGVSGFCSLRAMSRRNDDPEAASRPFDRDRDGFVMGEGSGILVLEELEHARARGAKIYAELLGVGWNADAFHITQPAPEGAGAVDAIRLAIQDARVDPSEIDYINAHGTSTEFNDRNESAAIRTVLGEQANKVVVNSTKSMTGHLLGASGGVESVVMALSVANDIVHPTRNLENPGEGCDLDYCPGSAREIPVRVALSNSFGFGGHNVAVLMGKLRD